MQYTNTVLRVLTVLFLSCQPIGASAEMVTTADDQQSVSLTVYNSDLALVRDTRMVTLPTGEITLAFKEISSMIQPETALLSDGAVEILEQNYEFDLLSPESLLNKYVGREVAIVRSNKETGEQTTVSATVLSTAGGVVLQIGDTIETQVDGRIIYPDVPENLRDKPTLSMLVVNDKAEEQQMELTYLTRGLNWKADYIVRLNEAEDRVDVKGWVTLSNRSGISYRNSRLQLVAGEVNRVKPESGVMPMSVSAEASSPRGRQEVQREELFEYHLYSIERPTTILDNQSKQIALLEEKNGICTKELLLSSRNPFYYWSKVGEISKSTGVDVFLHMQNDKASNLGQPKPAGTMRVYKQDSSGSSQFVGEDTIDHTPENEIIRIQLGQSFDVTADRLQTDFKIINGLSNNQRIYESEYEILLKNAKAENVEVTVEEAIPGDWTILSESLPHTKKSSKLTAWKVSVPAGKSATLRYRVRTTL